MQNMEAKITLTGTPREFDLTREALSFYRDTCVKDAGDKENDPQNRRETRSRAVELSSLLEKLK